MLLKAWLCFVLGFLSLGCVFVFYQGILRQSLTGLELVVLPQLPNAGLTSLNGSSSMFG